MIGRDDTLQQLLSALGRGPACVVSDPGMGKSTLLSAAAEALTERGDVVIHVVGTESARTVPWGALRHSRLAPWLPEHADAPDELADLVEQHLAPDALVIDEVQSLDPATAAWVRHMVEVGDVPILLAWRAGALADDALLAALAGAAARTVALAGLSEPAVRALVEQELGPVADSLVRAVAVHTGGNPMLVLSTVRQWDGQGLVRRGGITRLVGEPTAPLPLAEAARARIAALPPELAATLRSVALAEPVPLEGLAALVGEDVLERCEALGLITLEQQGQLELVRTSHPTLAHAAVTSSSPQELERAAAGLLGLADPAASAVQRGQWMLLAGPEARTGADAGHALVVAAEEARRFHDLPLAQQLAEAARGAGIRVRPDLVLAEIAMASGQWARAEAVLDGLGPAATTDEERVLVVNAHAYVLGQLGRPDDAWQVLRAATEAVSGEHRAALQARAAIARLFEADAEGALEMAAPLVDSPEPSVRARACYAAAIALGLRGEATRAAEVADLGQAAFQGLAPAPAVTQIGAVLAGVLADDLAVAEQRARLLMDQMLAVGDREGEATGSFLLGRIALERADAAEAQRQFRASAAAAQEIGDPVALRWALGGLLHALVLAGGDAAAEAAQVAEQLRAEPTSVRLFEDDVVVRALALHRASTGEHGAAVAMLLSAAQEAAGPRRAVAALLATEALLLPSAGAPEAIVVPVGDGTWHPTARPDPAALAAALATADLAGLEQAWQATAGAGAALCAGALAARVAQLLPAADREAALWRVRASAVGALGPWRSAAPVPAALSPRQRQVAELAAQGLTSAQIAERLGMSPRTAENHLQQAYRTLGVRSRDELRAALGL
jgi:DNA-binding CsgD family transcriptional regulator